MKATRLLGAAVLFLLIIPGGLLYIGRYIDAIVSLSIMLQLKYLVGAPILITGIMLSIASIWQLYAYGSGMPWGDVSSDSQSSRLVTQGLYRYTRNPMLLGYFLFLMGVGLFFGSFALALILSTLFVSVVSFWIKTQEEPELVKRFGQEYIRYREITPFIIPRLLGKAN